ncbi:MAG: branched-chain amino acid ABC transporter permease [Cyclobacteriaceae bacterium]
MIQVGINIIIATALYALLSLMFQILFKTTKVFHIAHAITLTLGSYITYSISIQFKFSLLFASLISIFCGIGLMLLVKRFIYEPMQKLKVESWQMLITSIGVYVVLQNIVSLIWGDTNLSLRTWEVKVGNEFLGAYITDIQIVTIICCVILLIFSWVFIEKTKIGQQIKAVSSNPQLSSYYGISTNRATLYSFALGSSLAAFAGILIAADTDMTPTMGFNWLLFGIVAMIIGGMGKMGHIILGALLLATAQHLSAYYIDSKWMNATAYIILIIFLYFKPYGFSGLKLKKQEV